MRLREVKFILESIDIKNSFLSFQSAAPRSGYNAKNIINFKKFINVSEILPFFQSEIKLLKKSNLYSTTQDALHLSEDETNSIRLYSSYIVNAAEALCRVLSSIIPESRDNSIYIKLPCPKDFLSLISFQVDFEKSINQVITNDKINGNLKINSWESGSFWIELALGSQAAVALIAGIAWSAAVISKKIKEGKILEQQVLSLEIKNESLQDILEKQKMVTDLLIQQEVRHLQVSHFDSDEDNEQFERLKMATKTFAELIQRGAEVHPALNAPEQAQNLFPNYKNIETLASQIKLLESSTPQGNQG